MDDAYLGLRPRSRRSDITEVGTFGGIQSELILAHEHATMTVDTCQGRHALLIYT
jgi:hypothetical protein